MKILSGWVALEKVARLLKGRSVEILAIWTPFGGHYCLAIIRERKPRAEGGKGKNEQRK